MAKKDVKIQKEDSLDERRETELDEAFVLCDNIVTKRYLSSLERMRLRTPDEEFLKKPIFEQASLFNVKRLVYNKDESSLQKLVNTYASAAGTGNSIVMVLESNGRETALYLGTMGASEVSGARGAARALRNSLIGNFPGSLYDEGGSSELLDNRSLGALLEKCTSGRSVSAVSGIGSVREKDEVKNESYIQGMEKLIDTMQGVPFSAILIANSLGQGYIDDICAEYELIYSKLAPFLKSELSFNESSSEGVSKTLSKSLGTTLTKSSSSALSVGKSESHAHTEAGATTHSDTIGVGAGKVNYSHSISRTKSWADTATFGTTENQTQTIGDAEAKSEIKSTSDGTTSTKTTGRSLQITYMNRTVQQLLATIDEQIERLKESANYGVFAVASYFFADTPEASRRAAGAYKGLVNGNCTHVESSNISTWYDEHELHIIKQYLSRLCHPEFVFDQNNTVTPATVVSGRELAVQMGLPRRSVRGVTVIEAAPFGRNPEHIKGRRYINVGSLYHMGREEADSSVELDIDSLTAHTFITGSTGSGKSNAVYTILEKLLERSENYGEDLSFLVIEPAKGEYKNVFGSRSDVRILGTNARVCELLKINPFSFPEKVHVLEHIDRLIEIFNVCWPMYAAMPAVLKDAVERAYIIAGWDLDSSECSCKGAANSCLYPTFADVLLQINKVMDESRYSADSKGDYVGALSTRLRSLTNGIYGQIFSSRELSSEELFDKNVIVDLSRVGSVETKSLIMGLLVLKMQEYRMASSKTTNRALRHVTVLEEAHNLLKRTSAEQSSEGANLLGKSVEMLANAVAEMRTYGEGFIIADQAPGLLDMSVIRNTNTKIILRLPDMEDRVLVGRAAALNDSRIEELSRLRTGVAAIYQNNWEEAVLCKISRAESKERPYSYEKKKGDRAPVSQMLLLEYLLVPVAKRSEFDRNRLKIMKNSLIRMDLPAHTKKDVLRYIEETDERISERLRARIVYDFFNTQTALAYASGEVMSAEAWYGIMEKKLVPDITGLGDAARGWIISAIAKEQAERTGAADDARLFEELVDYVRRRG